MLVFPFTANLYWLTVRFGQNRMVIKNVDLRDFGSGQPGPRVEPVISMLGDAEEHPVERGLRLPREMSF